LRTVSRRDLVRDIQRIGVKEGDCLALGVSLRSVGWVEGGPGTLIDALQSVLGPDGTMMIPSYTRVFPLPLSGSSRGGGLREKWGGIIPREFIFDPAETPPKTGAVPLEMWRRPGAVRSRHPAFSIVAIGRDAEYLTEGHDEQAPGFLPYAKLVELSGRALFIGLKGRLVSLRHHAQHEAGLLDILPPRYGVRYRKEDGSTGLYLQREFACTTTLPKLNEEMLELGMLRRGPIGEADSLLAEAGPVVEHLARRLRQSPELSLCRDYGCLWCREIERIFNLYGAVGEPEIFQRNRVLRSVTGMLNRMRIRNSLWGTRAVGLLNRMIRRVEPPRR
jgi:aminoglycoside 3-N-acetyltransferase